MRCADLGPLVLRVILGLVFFMHGWQKLAVMKVDGTAGFLSDLGFPMPEFFAIVLIAVEIIAGLALIAGLFTHIAAKLALIVAVVAFFAVHLKQGFFIAPVDAKYGYEFILLVFAAAFSLMLTGGGKYSLDAKMMGCGSGSCKDGKCESCGSMCQDGKCGRCGMKMGGKMMGGDMHRQGMGMNASMGNMGKENS